MALKKVSKIQPMFSKEDIENLGAEYAEVSAQIKQLEERKKFLSEKIKNGAEQYGVKDDKGSFYFENDKFIFGKVAKKTCKINQDKAVSMLEALGLGDVVDVITTKVVNENNLEKAVSEGRISLNTVNEFTDISTSYSVSVKEKVEMPEVEQSTLKAAKTKK